MGALSIGTVNQVDFPNKRLTYVQSIDEKTLFFFFASKRQCRRLQLETQMVKAKPRGRRIKQHKSDEGAEDSHDKENWLIENEDFQEKQDIKPAFFGLVDANERDYFKKAESTLNTDAFSSEEERKSFIKSVIEEIKGKELKLVTNQIFSKLMERLILSATDSDVKGIFKLFKGHFVPLAYHKYSSHVLETLLNRCATIIEKELLQLDTKEIDGEENENESKGNAVVMEYLFKLMLEEYFPFMKEMAEHLYSSHVLRILILVVSGRDSQLTNFSNTTLRSRKSKLARKMIDIKDNDEFSRDFETPPSFKEELSKIHHCIISNETMQHMRELAIHKIASPVIQILIQTEGLIDKHRSVWHLIFLSDQDEADAKEGAFIEYLLSDPVGSHFFESIIKEKSTKVRNIERLFNLYIKDRILRLVKRTTTGVFVVQALLFKLRQQEVQFILDQIIPKLPNLISFSENESLELTQNVIDASTTKKNYRRDELVRQLLQKCSPSFNTENLDRSSSEILTNILLMNNFKISMNPKHWFGTDERRRSLFLEKLLQFDYNFVLCTWVNILSLPDDTFYAMCVHGVFSHVIESSLFVLPAKEQESKSINILRKKILNKFQSKVVDLSCNAYGSHLVDKLWDFTFLLNMYKDRIASLLMNDSEIIKENVYGKMVWKNWSMELFTRKKHDWRNLIRKQEETYFNELPEHEGHTHKSSKFKRPIELKLELLHNKNPDSKGNDGRINRKRQKV